MNVRGTEQPSVLDRLTITGMADTEEAVTKRLARIAEATGASGTLVPSSPELARQILVRFIEVYGPIEGPLLESGQRYQRDRVLARAFATRHASESIRIPAGARPDELTLQRLRAVVPALEAIRPPYVNRATTDQMVQARFESVYGSFGADAGLRERCAQFIRDRRALAAWFWSEATSELRRHFTIIALKIEELDARYRGDEDLDDLALWINLVQPLEAGLPLLKLSEYEPAPGAWRWSSPRVNYPWITPSTLDDTERARRDRGFVTRLFGDLSLAGIESELCYAHPIARWLISRGGWEELAPALALAIPERRAQLRARLVSLVLRPLVVAFEKLVDKATGPAISWRSFRPVLDRVVARLFPQEDDPLRTYIRQFVEDASVSLVDALDATATALAFAGIALSLGLPPVGATLGLVGSIADAAFLAAKWWNVVDARDADLAAVIDPVLHATSADVPVVDTAMSVITLVISVWLHLRLRRAPRRAPVEVSPDLEDRIPPGERLDPVPLEKRSQIDRESNVFQRSVVNANLGDEALEFGARGGTVEPRAFSLLETQQAIKIAETEGSRIRGPATKYEAVVDGEIMRPGSDKWLRFQAKRLSTEQPRSLSVESSDAVKSAIGGATKPGADVRPLCIYIDASMLDRKQMLAWIEQHATDKRVSFNMLTHPGRHENGLVIEDVTIYLTDAVLRVKPGRLVRNMTTGEVHVFRRSVRFSD